MYKAVLLAVGVIALEVVVAIMMISPVMIQNSAGLEARWVYNSLGADTAQLIKDKADHWYTTIIIENKVEERLVRHFIPSEEERANSRGMEDLGSWLWSPTRERISALMDLTYWIFRRFALFMMWLPICLPSLLLAGTFGLLERQIKRTNFSYASPAVLRYSWRACALLTLGFFILFLLPLAVHPSIVPIIVSFVMVAMGISFSNLAKKL